MYTEEMLFQKIKELQEDVEASKQSIIFNEAKISVYKEIINDIKNQKEFNEK